jgi:hypothetical protein
MMTAQLSDISPISAPLVLHQDEGGSVSNNDGKIYNSVATLSPTADPLSIVHPPPYLPRPRSRSQVQVSPMPPSFSITGRPRRAAAIKAERRILNEKRKREEVDDRSEDDGLSASPRRSRISAPSMPSTSLSKLEESYQSFDGAIKQRKIMSSKVQRRTNPRQRVKNPGKKYPCTQKCGQEFKKEADIKRHLGCCPKTPEDKRTTEICWICNTVLSRADALKRHVASMHKGSPAGSKEKQVCLAKQRLSSLTNNT